MGTFNPDKGVAQAPKLNNAPHIKPLDLGSILSGVGETVGNVVQETDTNNRQYINDEIRKAYEIDNKIFGVEDASKTDAPAGGQVGAPERMGETPASMKQSVERLGKLKQAYQQGLVSETNYQGRMAAVMRELRARFPGYDDEIDKVATRIVGENPDHALRKLIQKDAMAAQSRAQHEQDQMEKFFDSEVGRSINARAKFLAGSPLIKLKLEADKYVSDGESMKRRQAELSLQKSEGANVEDKVESHLRQASSMIYLTEMGNELSQYGITDFKSFREWALKASKDGLDPQELEIMSRGKAILMSKYNTRFEELVNFRASPELPSARGILKSERIKEIRDTVNADMEAMFASIEKGDLAPLHLAQAKIDAMKNNDELVLKNKFPDLRVAETMQKVMGAQAFSMLIEKNPEALKRFTNPALIVTANELMRGIETGKPVSAKHLTGTPELQGSAEANYSMITGAFLSGKMTPEQLKQYSTAMFGEQSRQELGTYLTKIPSADRQRFLNIVASGEMARFMAANKSANPSGFQDYFKFIRENVPALVFTEKNNMMGLTSDSTHTITMDNYGNFQVVQKPGISKQVIPPPGSLRESVGVLNSALGAYRELYRANGADGAVATQAFMKDLGIDLNAEKPKSAANPSAWWDAVSSGLKNLFEAQNPQEQDTNTKDTIKGATPQKRSALPDPLANELGYAPIQRTSSRSGGLQAIEANMGPVVGSYHEGLKTIRNSGTIAQELKIPEVRNALLALTEAEVGGYDKEDYQAFIETVLNRAAARKMSLVDVLSDTNYYPSRTFINASKTYGSESMEKKYASILEDVLSGSNISGFATGNASGTVGFNKGRETYKARDRFGIEGPDLPWADQFGTPLEKRTMMGYAQGEATSSWASDRNLSKPIRDNLTVAQGLVDFPIKVRSGYRDPATNARVGGAQGSEHMSGNAVDIDLRGLSDEQRTTLVRALVKAGFNRLGAYSGNTGLHVDMKEQRQDDGSPWAMMDRTAANMERAPRWFKDGLNLGWAEANLGKRGLLDPAYSMPTNSGSLPTQVGALGDRWIDEGRASTNIEDRRGETAWEKMNDQEKADMIEMFFPLED